MTAIMAKWMKELKHDCSCLVLLMHVLAMTSKQNKQTEKRKTRCFVHTNTICIYRRSEPDFSAAAAAAAVSYPDLPLSLMPFCLKYHTLPLFTYLSILCYS